MASLHVELALATDAEIKLLMKCSCVDTVQAAELHWRHAVEALKQIEEERDVEKIKVPREQTTGRGEFP